MVGERCTQEIISGLFVKKTSNPLQSTENIKATYFITKYIALKNTMAYF